MHITLVPRPEGLRPVRQRSPLVSALSMGMAGVVTALLFSVFMSVAPVGSLFARESAPATRASHKAASSVASPMVLPTVRVIASR